MIVEPDFPDHWKTQLLIQLTGDLAAPMMVIRLWAHCQQRKAWEFEAMSNEALAAVCRWKGEPADLRKHLTHAQFIEASDEGTVCVHEWDQVNASLIKNWVNGARGGRPPKTQPKPSENPTATDRGDREEKIEKRREDRLSPQPPSGGAGKSRGKAKTGLIPDAQPEPMRSRMLTLNALAVVKRRATSKWDADEVEALKASGLLEQSPEDFAEDLAAMATFYAAKIPREMEIQFCRRTGLLTLLRHWAGELDKAMRWAGQHARENDQLPRLSDLKH